MREEDYFKRWLKGDEKGFEYFFSLYYTRLLYFALQYLNVEEDAEDIVQSCFCKIWMKVSLVAESKGVKSYLYQMVYNGCIDELRRRKKQNRHLGHYDTELIQQSFIFNVIRAETISLLYEEMSRLPNKIGKVIHMHYRQGLEIEEIALRLKVSVHTVRNQRARGLELLRKRFPNLAILPILALLQGMNIKQRMDKFYLCYHSEIVKASKPDPVSASGSLNPQISAYG